MHAHAHAVNGVSHPPRRRNASAARRSEGSAPSSAQLVPASRPIPWPPAAQVRPRVRPMRPCTRPSRGSRRRGRLAAAQVTLAADQVAQPSASSATSSASPMQPEQASMHGACRPEPSRAHAARRTGRSTAAQRRLTPGFCTTGPERGGDADADRASPAVEAREEEPSAAGTPPRVPIPRSAAHRQRRSPACASPVFDERSLLPWCAAQWPCSGCARS